MLHPSQSSFGCRFYWLNVDTVHERHFVSQLYQEMFRHYTFGNSSCQGIQFFFGGRPFEVRRPKCEEGRPEVLIREGPEELTLRAEEVGTQKSCVNVDQIAQERWRSPLVDADCHAFCQAIYKGIEGKDWTEFYEYFKEMRKAARVKKPNENQRAFWTGEMIFMIQNAKTTSWRETKHDWNYGKSTSKTRSWHWTKL